MGGEVMLFSILSSKEVVDRVVVVVIFESSTGVWRYLDPEWVAVTGCIYLDDKLIKIPDYQTIIEGVLVSNFVLN